MVAFLLPLLLALPPPAVRDASFARGISLGLFVSSADPEYQRATYGAFLEEIRALGATDVQLVVRWAQADVRATEIAPDAAVSTPDATVEWVAGEARRLGLRVFMMPILHLRARRGGEWRGRLKPADLDAWWRSYRAFVLHYARLAQRSGVTLYSVGSELVSMERHRDRWRGLAAEVREVYAGRLTYSANWDHFEPVTFWDALDVVGLSVYPPLAKGPDPSEERLVQGFEAFTRTLRGWAAREGKRYLITEVGYPSHPWAARRPWDHTPRGPADPTLQERCYRALFRTWHADPRLEGVFVWNWFGHGGPDDVGYTPRHKPAAEVLRRWFNGGAPTRTRRSSPRPRR